MPDLVERLDESAHVKGSLVGSHLAWAEEAIPDFRSALEHELASQHLTVLDWPVLNRPTLATSWIPFATFVALDRAIATLVGGDPLKVYEALGRASARHSLEGEFRSFTAEDPHIFFRNSAQLHDRYQDFGAAHYEEVGEREGRFCIRKSIAFSPVHCAGERGYLADALVILGATDSPTVTEEACRCAGDDGCTFAVAW